MSNFGYISKKKVAKEIANTVRLYDESTNANMYYFNMGACSALNLFCSKLNIKPMHRNELGGGTGEMIGK